MSSWSIYYGDGEVANSADWYIEDVPRRGVIVIAQASDIVGRHLVSRFDYYIWETEGEGANGWYGVDAFGRDEYCLDRRGSIWLAGRNLKHEHFQAIYTRAAKEKNSLPLKSNWSKDEFRPSGLDL